MQVIDNVIDMFKTSVSFKGLTKHRHIQNHHTQSHQDADSYPDGVYDFFVSLAKHGLKKNFVTAHTLQ